MPSEQEQRIFAIFLEEAQDHLNTLENGLVDLKATIADPERVNEMFRAAHSVKGGAAMLTSMSPSLENVRKTAHRLEDCFKIIREHPISIDQTVEDQFLGGYDVLKALVEKMQSPYGLREDEGKQIVEQALPLFTLLEKNLNSLLQGGGTEKMPGTPGAGKPSGAKVPADFAVKVKTALKQVLQLFKQPESPASRQKLAAACGVLAKLGAGIGPWENLLQTSQKAVMNSKASYKVLAPLIIKELSQAADLIQGGKGAQVAPSDVLQKLVPGTAVTPAPVPVPAPVAEKAATPAPAGVTFPKDPKALVKLLIKHYNKKELQAITKILAQYEKSK